MANKIIDADLQVNGKVMPTTSEIATVETTTTASKAYAVGDLLIYNGTLYKVTSAISSGGTITIGTNVSATTVESLIKTLPGAVRYDQEQSLTSTQKTQARENIDAPGLSSVNEFTNDNDFTDTLYVDFDNLKDNGRSNYPSANEVFKVPINKSLYNLGAYDTFVDNEDDIITITRQTGYAGFDSSWAKDTNSVVGGTTYYRWYILLNKTYVNNLIVSNYGLSSGQYTSGNGCCILSNDSST